MKEFIDKLTKKLYENVKSKSCPNEACWAHLNKNCDNCDSKEIEVTDVIRIANELAEEMGVAKNAMTNADYIRSLSDRELAETLLDFLCDFDRSSYEDVWNWLKAEREG